MTESTEPFKPNVVRRANRGILLIVLFAGSVLTVFAADLGISEAAAFCLDALIVLMALQILLRRTADSPLEVLKRYRDINLPIAVGVTALQLVISIGVTTFASIFMPRLYNALIDTFVPNSAWELVLSIVGFAVLAPYL